MSLDVKQGELLIELFSEEIPARMQARAAEDFAKLMAAGLAEQGLAAQQSETYVTPRRLVLRMTGLPAQTPDVKEERKGPKVDAPEKAIEGFLKSTGLDRSACEERDMGKKGAFLFAVIEKPGRATTDVVADCLAAVIRKFPWPKSQRWGRGSLKWVRPLSRILCLFEGAVVPVEVEGYSASNITEGHRFHAPEPFEVTHFYDYRAKLLDAKVQIDQNRRAELIADSCQTLATAAGLDWVRDEGLLSEVAGLVEWPVPMIGNFEPDFLEVPEEVLILTMKQDQRYFVLRDPATGKLAPKFIFVANIEPTDGGKAVTAGNERVIRARLADARFFWEQDKKHSLESRLPALADIVFHEKLGTVAERVERMVALASKLAESIPGCDAETAANAARLAKADLVSQMVYEFPEVQGVMGRYYALHEGLGDDTANAIGDHYSPLGPNDDCPTAPVSVAVALAEKLDTLVGFFGIGQPPTGSKDPFALRRAALGVIRLIVENGIKLKLQPIIRGHLVELPITYRHDGDFKGKIRSIESSLLTFFADRLKVMEREKGTRHDLIDAVFAKGDDDLVRILARVKALQAFLGTDDGADLLAGYKRAANILKAEEKKGSLPDTLSVDPGLFSEDAEKNLYNALIDAQARSEAAIQSEDFEAAMAALSELREPIDTFFNLVTVNADDEGVRANRLALLTVICTATSKVADFSQIEG